MICWEILIYITMNCIYWQPWILNMLLSTLFRIFPCFVNADSAWYWYLICHLEVIRTGCTFVFRDCIKGVGYQALKKAYEILNKIDEDEVEVGTLGAILSDSGYFSLYNIRIFCFMVSLFVKTGHNFLFDLLTCLQKKKQKMACLQLD